ncbi:LPXTG cell wall anchor domain-containing protein [Streptococcus agalactiae]|uniref:LPXTG cell wall anchor domain-containing protein n=2 Tax=Streptococcus agalactiae TaxID=1311 RepID=UPI00363CA346
MIMQTKQIFSIRKFKTGTHSALLAKYGIALVASAVLMGVATVSADEVTTLQTQPATEQVTPATKQAQAPVQEQPAVTSDIATSVPSNTTQEQAVKAVDDAQATLKDNVNTAKDAGVVVAEGDTQEVVINDNNAAEKTNEVLTDLNKQDQAVKAATEKQRDNVKAYEETKAERETVVKEGQSSLEQSTAEVDKLMEQAKKAGLLVTETTTDKTPDYKDTKGLTGDALRQAMTENLELYKAAVASGLVIQGKYVEDLKNELALYQANQKAYHQANTQLKDAKSAGTADLELADGRQNEVVDLAKKNNVPIDVKSETVTPDYIDVKGLTGDGLLKTIESNIAKYQKAVSDSVAKQDGSTKDAKAKLDAYLKAYADFKAGKGVASGVKWAGNTTVEAGTAERMTGNEPAVSWGNLKTAAADAIQSLDRNQNTDAKFENLFKINGSGTVIIKNTTNGDVTLKISNIQAWTAENTYLAVWGAKDGGIAWGVFATTHGTVTSGAGEGATGGNIGASGAILANVKSYDYEVSTSKPVSTVTFNDIDNNQTVILNGLDGAKLVKGRNVTQSDNRYSSGAGDVSQASGGVIDSNGIQFNLADAKTVTFSGSHFLPGYINTSIVAGIFGVASEVPKEPKIPELEVTNQDVTVPEVPEAPKPIAVAVQKVTVDAPDASEAPAPVEVSVHYYEMKTTPTPEAPAPKTPVLPSTGEKSSLLAVLGGTLLAGLSLVGIRKCKEN